MNQLAAQQVFLPTDLETGHPVWIYVVSGIVAILGALILVADDDDDLQGLGVTMLIVSGMIVGILLFTPHNLDNDQNYENLKANIQTIYAVTDVDQPEGDLISGNAITVDVDGKTYEVLASWDEVTYEPKLSSSASTLNDDEIVGLKK